MIGQKQFELFEQFELLSLKCSEKLTVAPWASLDTELNTQVIIWFDFHIE